MTNLLDKLNVLVKSSLNSFLGDAAGTSGTPRVPAERLGQDIDGEVARLRQQIDAALNQEDAMLKRLEQLQQQIDSYDQQADAALQRNDEATARYLIQQMQRQQQLASMLQAELDEHRRATSEFIERVNMLEALVSDARRQQASAPAGEVQAQAEHTPGAVLSNLLREARERVEDTVGDMLTPAQSADPGQSIPIATEVKGPKETGQPQPPDSQIDADLAKRRARLSKPD
jgi:phage shock protein A